jgi:hypothetical protein
MEAITAAATAALIMKYLLPAIRDLGEKVWETSEDALSTAVVGFGKRLLHTLLPGRLQPARTPPEIAVLENGIERRVLAIMKQPSQEKAASQLEGAIEDLLVADPDLLASITELLKQAPGESATQSGRLSYVGRDNSGAVITGDGNSVTYRR